MSTGESHVICPTRAPRRTIYGVAIPALTLAVLASGVGAAGAQPAGYTARKSFGVLERSGTTLTQYQVRLVIDTAALIGAGTMRTDGADMVFTRADCNFATLPHWVESGINSQATVVWVKVPSLPASAQTKVLMWHGNPTASSTSSPRNVFLGAANGDPLSSTNQVTGGTSGGVGSSQRGFRFAPNVDVLVVDAGKNEPNGTTRYFTLFDQQTQAILRQMQISGPASTYTYTPLAQPLWLSAGREYSVQLFQGASDGYFFGTSSQIAADLTYRDMRYCNGCNQNTFPTLSLTSYHYGYPDFRYYKRQVATIEPAQMPVTTDCTESVTCDVDCTAPMCGDGVPNSAAGEDCDDGNAADTDKCLTSCDEASCGDGFVYAGFEQCDDGNMVDTDGCRNDCTVLSCGDGMVQGNEQCDDGNADDTDACLATCIGARCGDNHVRVGVEICDDGNNFDGDDCPSDCGASTCPSCDAGDVGADDGGGGCCGTGARGPHPFAFLAVALLLWRRRRHPPPVRPDRAA